MVTGGRPSSPGRAWPFILPGVRGRGPPEGRDPIPRGGNASMGSISMQFRDATPKHLRSSGEQIRIDDFSGRWLRRNALHDISNASPPEHPAVAVCSLSDCAVCGGAASPEETLPFPVGVKKIGEGEDLANLGASTTPSKVNHVLDIPQSLSGRQGVEGMYRFCSCLLRAYTPKRRPDTTDSRKRSFPLSLSLPPSCSGSEAQ